MLAEIITIGDEILIGQTIDTNSAWMGEKLNQLGIQVVEKIAVSDSKEGIEGLGSETARVVEAAGRGANQGGARLPGFVNAGSSQGVSPALWHLVSERARSVSW